MAAKRSWREKANGEVWIDHAVVTADDLDRLRSVRWLTVWNVKFPDGFLAQLPGLEWLDLRGGSRRDLSLVEGCDGLRGLVVNQVRGLEDASAISTLSKLEILELYGLARLERLPQLNALTNLRRIQLGQLRGLREWEALTAAPGLRELVFVNKLEPQDSVVAALSRHPSLETFSWYASDEPTRKVERVTEAIGKASATAERPEEWLRRHS